MNLRFDQEWVIGEQIGGGGFGRVYAASSPGCADAVVKLVPKSPGAERELLFADLASARNVVPIIDSGETEDSWVLVMPRAKESLREHIDEHGGALDVPASIAILRDVAVALAELAGVVVHRDLKPENILLLGESWCLADFGISRYADATTATNTRKHALSAPYAAPERWRDERATPATDIYSLGVIGYELISGTRPFAGPAISDFREQHLHGRPADLNAAPAGLEALIEECLDKTPESRPSAATFLARVERVSRPATSPGLARLQEANRAAVGRQSETARRRSEERTAAERLAALAEAASTRFARIAEALLEAVSLSAPAASVAPDKNGGWRIRLGQSELELDPPTPTLASPWGSWEVPAFTVVAHSAIGVRIPPDRHEYEGRSHSLWYCDAQDPNHFQWFETSFMISPMIPKQGRQDPFALNPGESAAKALWTGMSEFQAAWPFEPLVIGDLDTFIDRWATWFAQAAEGQLRHPSSMPERQAEGTWRRSR